jgi:hypothetical protein
MDITEYNYEWLFNNGYNILYIIYIYYNGDMILVGGIPTPLKLKDMKVSWDDEIPNI